MSHDDILPIPPLQPPVRPDSYGEYRIAMVINDVVHTVLMLPAIDAARYLSEPKFVQIPKSLYVEVGYSYTDETFRPPVD
jgi:hypothetical protein